MNKTDKITLSAYTGQYINYIYDANGSVMEKQQNNGTTLTTTMYVDGFVYVNGALSYFPTPEGRVTASGTTLTNEYIITDQQGNARVSFNNTGTGGAAKVIQETSYYGYGMVMPGSTVTGGTNKDLYNGGSEWQNDFSNLPDYYQTFYRNYDAAIGRFVGMDPTPESAADMSNYHYAGDNPIMSNDPIGDAAAGPGQKTLTGGYNGSLAALEATTQLAKDIASGAGQTGGHAPDAVGGLFGDYVDSDIGGGSISPALYQALLAASTNIYHAGDGDEHDPSTGISLADLIGLMKGAESVTINETTGTFSTGFNNAYTDASGNVLAGSAGILAIGHLGKGDMSQENQCPTCLISSSAGQNLWHTNYTGQYNPISYNGQENYTLAPTNLADYGAFVHDKGYDRYRAVGPNSVLTDTRTIGVDYQFIGYELNLAINPVIGSPEDKLEGLANGLYMFVATLPKTIVYGLSAIKN